MTHLVPALFSTSGGIIGGAERYALELARHMADEVPTRLVTFGDTAASYTIGRLDVEVIPNAWHVRGNRSNPVSLRVLPALRDADVIHCHQRAILSTSLAAIGARLTGRVVVVTDLGGGGWDLSAFLPTDRWFHRHLHISEYSRRAHGHDGKPWASIISGGVDTGRFSQRARPAADGPVLFVGRLLPHKGIHDLIRAIPPGITLEVIGQPYDQRYFETLHTLAEGRSVRFRTSVGDDELVASYQRALCVVLPSVYESEFNPRTGMPELLGQTLLEGMSCGVPALTTNVASLPEVVDDGVTGWIVEPNAPDALADRIRWFRDEPDRAAAMGLAARRRVEALFTWPRVVERCLDAYSLSCASESAGRGRPVAC